MSEPMADSIIDLARARKGKYGPRGDKRREFPGLLETRVHPGVYVVGLVGDFEMRAWNRRICCLAFQIVEPVEYLGLLVPRFATRLRATTLPARRSTLYRDYTHVTGLKPPRHFHRLEPRTIYSDCRLKVLVGDVVKDSDGAELTGDLGYSVVRRIMERVEGTPPCLSGRGAR